MLKRKLVKAGFFGHGALFIMVSPFSISPKAQVGLYSLTATNTVHQDLCNDTSILQTANTVVLTGSDTVAKAPEIKLNAAATKYAKQFIKKNGEALELAEKRSERYFKIIEPVFQKYDLPLELKYLAVVESQLKASAVSHAGAKGPWQLMTATARELGLKVNKKQD